mgnify:CR=1 FL=1
MIYKLRHIFIFLFVFSVFSLTLQASIINACKDSKVFKNQSQNNPVAEEEEERYRVLTIKTNKLPENKKVKGNS